MGGFAFQSGYISGVLAGKAGGSFSAETRMSKGTVLPFVVTEGFIFLTGVIQIKRMLLRVVFNHSQMAR